MRERRIIVQLILIMTAVSIVVGGVTTHILYRAAVAEQRAHLANTVESQARSIETTAQFSKLQNPSSHPDGWAAPTLSQVIAWHKQYRGFGETGEFTVAKRVGDQIVSLLDHRHFDLDQPKPIPFDGQWGEPIRRAVSGSSGTMIGLDYRGVQVLAAYRPVAELNWGIVAKIDLAEVRAPFVRAGIIVGGVGLVAVLAGAVLFLRLGNPLVRRLEESEARTRAIVETAADGVVTVDADGKVVSWNRAAEKMFGFAATEAHGGPLDLVIPERFRTAHRDALDRYRRTGHGHVIGKAVELVGLRKDGSEFPVELSLAAMRAGDGQLFTGIIRDISDRKRAEEMLHRAHHELEVRVAERTADLTKANARLQCEMSARMRAEEERAAWNSRYQAAIEATGHILFDWDPRADAVIWSGSVKATLGYEIDELGSWDHWLRSVVHPTDVEVVRRELERSLAERVPFQVEYRARRRDGEYTSVEARGRFILDAAGNPVRMLGFIADITERKRAEEAHRLDEARLKALVKLNDMADARFEQVADFSLEEAVKLTESDLGFLGFMEDNESVMNIHAWSGQAMEQCQIADKPREFPIVEAGLWAEVIRQRLPVVVNDYPASETWKRGYPEGHVRIARVLVVPVFDGERIVAIAAAANKERDYEEGDT